MRIGFEIHKCCRKQNLKIPEWYKKLNIIMEAPIGVFEVTINVFLVVYTARTGTGDKQLSCLRSFYVPFPRIIREIFLIHIPVKIRRLRPVIIQRDID